MLTARSIPRSSAAQVSRNRTAASMAFSKPTACEGIGPKAGCGMQRAYLSGRNQLIYGGGRHKANLQLMRINLHLRLQFAECRASVLQRAALNAQWRSISPASSASQDGRPQEF